MGSITRMDTKLPLKFRDVSWPLARNPSFQSDRPDPGGVRPVIN